VHKETQAGQKEEWDYSNGFSHSSCSILWWQSQHRNWAIRAGFGSNGRELIAFPQPPHFQFPRYIFLWGSASKSLQSVITRGHGRVSNAFFHFFCRLTIAIASCSDSASTSTENVSSKTTRYFFILFSKTVNMFDLCAVRSTALRGIRGGFPAVKSCPSLMWSGPMLRGLT